jgi:hypothetical protein
MVMCTPSHPTLRPTGQTSVEAVFITGTARNSQAGDFGYVDNSVTIMSLVEAPDGLICSRRTPRFQPFFNLQQGEFNTWQ